MDRKLFFIFVCFSIGNICMCEDPKKNVSAVRQPRNFDNLFGDEGGYVSEEQYEKPVYLDAGPRPLAQRNDDDTHSSHGNAKAPEKSSFYYPFYPVTYKGYPYYEKGGPMSSPPVPPMTPDKMMDVMTMMNTMMKMEKDNSEKEVGFFEKIFSDPKSILIPALIPLSIMLSSFIPLIFNYFMTGVSLPSALLPTGTSLPSVLSTTANSKNGRNLGDQDNFKTLFETVIKYGEKMEGYGCIEEAMCSFVNERSNSEDAEYAKRIIKAVAKAMKAEWFGASKLADIVSAMKHKTCSNVCEKEKIKKKKGHISM